MSDQNQTTCECLGGSTHATDDLAFRRCDLCGGIVPTDLATGQHAPGPVADNQTTELPDWRKDARECEIGKVQQALYIALGAATLLGDEELIEQLRPIVWRYRIRTRDELEGTPYV